MILLSLSIDILKKLFIIYEEISVISSVELMVYAAAYCSLPENSRLKGTNIDESKLGEGRNYSQTLTLRTLRRLSLLRTEECAMLWSAYF